MPGSEKNAPAVQTQLLTRTIAFQICYKMERKESCMLNFPKLALQVIFLSSFLSFFLILTSFYLLMEGVGGYSCVWSHWLTLTYTLGTSSLDEGSAHRRDSTWQHTTLTRDRHPCLRRDKNPQSQQMSGRRPSPSSRRPLRSVTQVANYVQPRRNKKARAVNSSEGW